MSILVALQISGCGGTTSLRPPEAATRTGVPTKFEQDSSCTGTAISQDCAIKTYGKALEKCLLASQYYESEINRSSSNSMLVGLFGTLAGSVFSIGAVGNAAKAWSGVSGAGNAYQSQLDSSAMGAASFKTAKENVDRNLRSTQKKAVDLIKAGTDWNELFAISLNTGSACAIGVSTE